jgi:ribonuclease R
MESCCLKNPGFLKYSFMEKAYGAMHNDKVMVRIRESEEDGKRPEGTVIRVISRAGKQMVGTFKKDPAWLRLFPTTAGRYTRYNVRPTKKVKVKTG